MILFNTTFCINRTDEQNFMQWVRTIYLPTATRQRFSEIKTLRVESPEPETATFAVQFVAPTAGHGEQWRREHLPALTAEAAARFGLSAERLLHFSTAMEIID